jgi:S1/P1 Nuclease
VSSYAAWSCASQVTLLRAGTQGALKSDVLLRSVILLAFLRFASDALGYGPLGHEIVGAVADRKLAGTDAGTKISALLNGMTLQRAANVADEIKAWDSKGTDDLSAYPHYPRCPAIEQQLRDFWKANPPGPNASDSTPSHHWFHYTDVPVLDAEKYADGKTGRGNWDIVHTIPYCIGVLRSEVPEDNPRKITKAVAAILLAHFVGDIHQPLHVGAEYFSESGQPVDPDRGATGLGDEGGNSLSFVENATAQHPRHYYHSFHAFWDLDSVRNVVIGTPDELPREKRNAIYNPAKEKLIADFVSNEPKKWRASGDPKTWAEQWANEILPLAREAHTRLQFLHIHREEKAGRVFAKGQAREINSGYREWSADIVRDELHKAGWRLAGLLQNSL